MEALLSLSLHCKKTGAGDVNVGYSTVLVFFRALPVLR